MTGKVCSWNSLQSSLQSVFPNDENYTYVIESYKELQQENFIGAPDYAFEVQVQINISSEEGAKQWLSKFFHILTVHIDIQEVLPIRLSAKEYCTKPLCIVNISKKP